MNNITSKYDVQSIYPKLISFLRLVGAVLLIAILDTQILRNIPRIVPQPQSPIAAMIPTWAFRLWIVGVVITTLFFSKRNSVTPYFLVYLVPLITWYSANHGSYWSIIWAVFGMIPILEFVTGEDVENPTVEEEKELNQRFSYRLVTMIWVPLQLMLLVWACWAVTVWKLNTIQFFILSVSIGFNTGILGINISHELIHKNNRFEVFLGKVLLVSVFYGHWYVEHLWGHHKMVSTPHDPASSKLGENFYAFWPRSVVGSFLSAYHLANESIKKKNLSWLHNEVIQLTISSGIILILVSFIWGQNAVIMYILQSLTAFTLLEIVNYIEHYGLERKLEPGSKTYESVNPTHSWNANARISNYFLFKLQRHSDHHAHAARRYQILRSFESSPQMPTGYAGMLLMALLPPLWFRIMDKKAKAFYKMRIETK